MAATETTPVPVETKPVPPAVSDAAGMAVEDLLERWATNSEPETKDEAVETETTTEDGSEVAAGAEGDDDKPVSEGDTGEPDGTEAQAGSDNPGAGKQKEDVSAKSDRVDNDRERSLERSETDNQDHPVTPLPPELAEIEALIDSAEYDPFNEDTQKKIVKTLLKTVKAQQDVIESARAVTQEAANKAAEEAYWKDYTTKNPDVGQTARKLWDESLANQSKKGYRGDALVAAATTEWEFRVDQAKSAAKARAAKPAEAKASPKGTSISPKSTVSARPPQPKPKTIDEKIESGAYGDLTKIL